MRCNAFGTVTGFLFLSVTISSAQFAPDPPSQSETPADIANRKHIEHALVSILLPDIDFNKSDLHDVIAFLNRSSKKHDPNHKGVLFVLTLNASPPKWPINERVSISLPQPTPLGEVLPYICLQANLKYTIEKGSVVFSYLDPSKRKPPAAEPDVPLIQSGPPTLSNLP
jgi:hypothetical protein